MGVCVRARAKRRRVSPTGERGARKKGEGGFGRGELSAESWGVFKKHSLATSFSKKDFVLVLRGKWEKAKFAGRKTPNINDIAPDGAENRGLPAEKFAEVGGTLANGFVHRRHRVQG